MILEPLKKLTQKLIGGADLVPEFQDATNPEVILNLVELAQAVESWVNIPEKSNQLEYLKEYSARCKVIEKQFSTLKDLV